MKTRQDPEQPGQRLRITPTSQLQCYRIKGTPFKLKVSKAVTSPAEMTSNQKQNLNLLFYNFNQQKMGMTQVIEEACVEQEGDNEVQVTQPKKTITDRLHSRNGSRRVTGTRRMISYVI